MSAGFFLFSSSVIKSANASSMIELCFIPGHFAQVRPRSQTFPACSGRRLRRVQLSAVNECSGSVDDLFVESRTIAWARTVVVGLGLCPFARGALDRARVRIAVTRAADENTLKATIHDEISLVCSSARDQVETTLVVAPEFANDDFLRFHLFGENLEEDLESNSQLVDRVMLARFHPQHVWSDASEKDDPVNFDKRAPYPIINILRADQVDEYIDRGETDGILERNQRTLENLGSEKLKMLYQSLDGQGRSVDSI